MSRADLDHDDVARIAFIDEREEGRITHVTPIPISLSVDLDGFEHKWQTSRRHDTVELDPGRRKILGLPVRTLVAAKKILGPLASLTASKSTHLPTTSRKGLKFIGLVS
jgi:hypothetical protein